MPFHRPIPESEARAKSSSGLKAYVEAEKLMQLAFVLPGAVLVGWLAGAWADKHFQQHWIMIAGIIFGCVSGLYYVIRFAMDAERRAIRADAEENQDQKDQEK